MPFSHCNFPFIPLWGGRNENKIGGGCGWTSFEFCWEGLRGLREVPRQLCFWKSLVDSHFLKRVARNAKQFETGRYLNGDLGRYRYFQKWHSSWIRFWLPVLHLKIFSLWVMLAGCFKAKMCTVDYVRSFCWEHASIWHLHAHSHSLLHGLSFIHSGITCLCLTYGLSYEQGQSTWHHPNGLQLKWWSGMVRAPSPMTSTEHQLGCSVMTRY